MGAYATYPTSPLGYPMGVVSSGWFLTPWAGAACPGVHTVGSTRKLPGWSKRILWVDLSRGVFREWRYPGEMALMFLGGRGFAAKILWDFLEPGADPLGPRNLFVAAVGPLTGLPGPNTGKLVVAAKSPLTGGYGDGNIGSWAAVQMRAAGWDAIVLEGASEKPVVLVVEDDRAWLEPAEDLRGLDAFCA